MITARDLVDTDRNDQSGAIVSDNHRALRTLVAAAVFLPIAVLVVLAVQTWSATWRDAERELARNADALAEYSLRVLEANRLAADRVNDLLRGLSDNDIRQLEQDLHHQLRNLILDLPLVQTVAVLDRTGHPLLTANVYPVPRELDFNDREWVRDLRLPGASRTHISKVHIGRLDGFLFFGVSRRRSLSGNVPPADGFDGVINISVEPNRVSAGFAELTDEPGDMVSLVRADGEILARRPGFTAPLPPLQTQGGFPAAVASAQERGIYRVTVSDGIERLFGYRKVSGYPVYAIIARQTGAIASRWQQAVAAQFAFGIPATVLLAMFAVIALRRAKIASEAQSALTAETARRAAAEAAQAAEARFRAVFESSVIGMALLDIANGEIIDVNDCLLAMTARTRQDAESGHWQVRNVMAPEFLPRLAEALAQAGEQGAFSPFESEFVRGDGTRLPVRLSSAALPGQSGRLVLLVQDISEQREAEARRDLMMREVEHRAKNTLAVVQSALRLGADSSSDARSLAVSIEGRVAALARAQSLLSEGRWLGADLRALAASALAALAGPSQPGESPRVILDGPPVTLPASAAQSVSMVLHELATNAVKYGSLSTQAGHVTLTWRINENSGYLHLTWVEQGGPPLTAPVTRRGFGSRLIDATIQHQLGGSVTRRWELAGLICEIAVALDRTVSSGAPIRSAEAKTIPSAAALGG
jgi:PAS domain S-box-containing protein